MEEGWVETGKDVWKKLTPEAYKIRTSSELGMTNPRIRQDHKPLMNKLETEFLLVLKSRNYNPVFSQSIRLTLADRCTYLPDFFVPVDGGTFFEVKGPHVWEDGWVKLKVAARMYPFWRFVLARRVNGQWEERIVSQ